MKKSLVLMLALTTALTLSLAALAADYGNGGGGSDDSGSTGSSNTGGSNTGNSNINTNPAPAPGSSSEATVTVVPPAAVADALKTAEPKVSVTGNPVISTNVVQSIKNTTSPITFVAANCSIKIDPATITGVGDINLGVSLVSPVAQSTFVNYFENNIATVQLAQRGSFGMTIELTVEPTNISNLDLTKPILAYSYNLGTNTYAPIANPKVVNGKLVVTTTVGDAIVFSNSPLKLKA